MRRGSRSATYKTEHIMPSHKKILTFGRVVLLIR